MSGRRRLRLSLPGLRRVLRRFWPYVRPHRALIAGSSAALLAGIVLRLLDPWPLKFVFDRVIRVRPGSADAWPAASLDTPTLLAAAAFAIVLLTALRALADYWSVVGFAGLGGRVLTAVRDDLYRHLQTLSLSFHTRARNGDLTVRVINDVDLLRDVAVTAALPLALNTLILVGMAAFMLWLQWELALIAAASAPLFWIWCARVSREIQETARQQRRNEGEIAATAAESMSAIKVVQALSLETRFADGIMGRSQKSLTKDLKARRLAAGLERRVDVLIAVATGAVLWHGAGLVLRGAMTPGDLLVFLTYLRRAFNPLQDFAKYTAKLARATAAGERVLEVLDREPDVQDQPGAIAAPPLSGAVRFDRVSFGYAPGQRVLDGIEFEVAPGQHVALVGPSGIGKSTITDLILRLYDPTAGRVMIDGRDIRDYTLASLRSQISVVLQESVLFAQSVADNIAYGAAGVSQPDVVAAARLANAHDFITELADGYETLLGERGVTLSHGQRQRIAIARALVRKAPILILDEPTSGLDEQNERAVTEALERLARGRTVFLVTHDLRLAAGADIIMYVKAGRVVERGTHAELLAADGRYAAAYRRQVRPPAPVAHGPASHAALA